MRESRVLKWSNSLIGDQYYDIRTDEMLYAAALSILQTRVELDFFPDPRSLERDGMHRRNIKRRDTLLIALNGNSEGEAFESMREELERINRYINNKVMRHQQMKQEKDKILQVLDNNDGKAALDIVASRSGNEEECIEIIIPQNCGEVKVEEEETPATIE